jgi:RHS repeat-associated protein
VLEYDGATGALLRWYSYALSPNGLLNQMNVAAATRATFLPDQLGSIIASFDSTSGGLTKTGYQAYGTSPSVSTPFGYTGQRFDPENSFYYYRARNYSTAYGRFLQTDPSGAPSDARGGYSSKANLYVYALNDPLNRIDATGMASDSNGYGGYSTGTIIGAAFLGIAAVVGAVALAPELAAIGAAEAAVEVGADVAATAAEEAAPAIGDILSGFHPDTLIHLTPDAEASFVSGVNPGTYFARLGDVSEMTVPEYQANVVGGAAAAGPTQSVSGFITATPGATGGFSEAGIFNNAGLMEYTNSLLFPHSGYVPLP